MRTPFDRVRIPNADPPVDVAVKTIRHPSDAAGPVDWVLLATKAQDTDSAREWLSVLCGPSTTVVVAQNGVEQAERGATVAPKHTTVIPAVTYCAAQRSAAGVVEHSAVQPVKFVVPVSENAASLQLCFADTFASVEQTSDWVTAAWKKLALNFVTAGICALTGRKSDIIRHSGVLNLMAALFDEFMAVARATGATINEDYRHASLQMIGGLPDGVAPSMLQDRLAGRPTEHDAMYGAVLRAADRAGLSAPMARCFYTLLDATGPTTT